MVGSAGTDSHSIPGLRRVHLPVRPAWLAVIFVGGSAGTAVRAWLEGWLAPATGHWPWVTLAINVGGALVLGALLEVLAETGSDRGWRRGVRLGVGTGVLGGFTTYSTFSVEILQLFRAGSWIFAVLYALCTVIGGLAAAYGASRLVRRALRGWRARSSL